MSRILLNSNYSNSNSNKQLLQSRASLNAKPQEVQTIISKMYLIKCTVSVNSKHVAVKVRTIVFLFVFFVIIIRIGWSNVNAILNFKMKYKPLPKVVQVKGFGWFNLSTHPFFHPLQCATLHCWCYLHVFNGKFNGNWSKRTPPIKFTVWALKRQDWKESKFIRHIWCVACRAC